MNAPARRGSGLTREEFRAFAATRPDEEHWELIGGIAMMMTPPTRTHQRIGLNLARLLDDALERHDPSLAAFERVGVTLAETPDYDPEPDVVVIDAAEPDERYAHRVHLFAEVVSSSDAPKVDSKRAVYRQHPACLVILTIEQTRAEVRLERRVGDGWSVAVLSGLDAVLDLAEFGLSCSLADLYRKTAVT